MDEQAKKGILRMIPYGLYVLGTKNGDEINVTTVNWITQSSFEPPLIVLAVRGDSKTHELLKASGDFSLSFLKTGQKKLAFSFFKRVKPEQGKFAGFSYSLAENGCPVMDDAAGFIAGKVVKLIEQGDHSVVIAEIKEALQSEEAKIMTLAETGAKYGG